MHRLTVILFILLPVAAVAQPCADWSDIMGPPRNLDRLADDILFHGDHLIVASQYVTVCEPTSPDYTVLGQCNPTFYYPKLLREVQGLPYLIVGTEGVVRLDLTDPANPTYADAYVPGTEITDLAEITGGVAIVNAGLLQVFDTIGGALLSETAIDPDLERIAAEGTLVVVWGNGEPLAVDLTNPAAPDVTPFRGCLPEGEIVGNYSYRDLILSDRVAYATLSRNAPDEPTVEYLESVDLLDPAAPAPVACLEIDSRAYLCLNDGLLIEHGKHGLVFRDPADFSEQGSKAIAAGNDGAYDVLVPHDDHLLLTRFPSLLWEYDLAAPYPIGPLHVMDGDYDPAGCGPFGASSWDEHGLDGETTRHFAYYDQSVPLAPVELLHQELTVAEDDPLVTRDIVAQNENWAVIADRTYSNPSTTRTQFLDGAGTLIEINVAQSAGVRLDGDTLWLNARNWDAAPDSLFSYDLSGAVPVMLHASEWDSGYIAGIIDDYMVVQDMVALKLYDVADPVAPNLVGVQDYNPFELTGPAIAHPSQDRMFIAPSYSGLHCWEITPDGDEPFLIHGQVYMDGDIEVVEPHGDLLAVAAWEEGHRWAIVSVTDPDDLVQLSPDMNGTVFGFAWSPPHLYVGTEYKVDQYDLTDPANPVWTGESAMQPVTWYPRSLGSLCRLDQVLMNDSWVLPLDCTDSVGIEGDEPQPDVPLRHGVVLHGAFPNPFNPRTQVSFDLPRAAHVTLTVHDLRGRRIATLTDHHHDAGRHVFTWHGADDDGRAMPSGNYLLRLNTENAVRTAKAVLIR